ncbi:MAG: general L-amino acid transport system permease protein [Cellvibrionaceae bacterium]|jgi:general L-amino acid transport system permease protein
MNIKKIKSRYHRRYKQLYKQLFGGITNAALTLGSSYLLYLIIPPIISWAIIDANWFGSNASDCTKAGACWVYISAWWQQLLFGQYPSDQLWRLVLCSTLFITLLSALLLHKKLHTTQQKKCLLLAILCYPAIAFILMYGGFFNLVIVETRFWGGLFLTLVIAVVGIVSSFPLGLLLALGRQSKLKMIRLFCIGFIELWRGVPLITILFMASVMFPLFMPQGVNIDSLLRVLVGVSLFSAAYMAEIIRGGLQAIPKGQFEAAKATGLSYWQSMFIIILPQAITLVIPSIVSAFISLIKETTLVYIIGMFDFLGIVQFTASNSEWIRYTKEGYVFVGAIFWIICYSLSRYSRTLEQEPLR